MSAKRLMTVCVVAIAFFAVANVGSASAAFGIQSFSTTYADPFGTPRSELLQAGGHPDVVTRLVYNSHFSLSGPGISRALTDDQPRDIEADLPAGFYGNPQAAEICTYAELTANAGWCNPAAQVGLLHICAEFADGSPDGCSDYPVYNMSAAEAQTAVLAVVAASVPAKIVISARTDGDYGLIARFSNLNQGLGLQKTTLTLWGVPADPVHDVWRAKGCFLCFGNPAGIPPKPFLTTPTRCEPVTNELHTDSWQEPGPYNLDGTADLADPRWKSATDTTPPLEGCAQLKFQPTLRARPTTNVADSPSGLEADLHIPQNTVDPEQPSTALMRTAVVKLPEGLVINPSGANGLDACSPAQIGLKTPVAAGAPHFTKEPAQCPVGARIGTVEVDTPVFTEPLKGSVYTMTPYQNPYGTLLGVYLVIEGKGLVIKQAGKVEPNLNTGRLTAVFDEIPQLPFEDFKLNFFGGAFGVLRTPSACGDYATSSTLTPWDSPETPTVSYNDEYAIGQAPAAGSCNPAAQPGTPSFESGTAGAIGGAFSPFVLKLSREDGTQQLQGIDTTLPPGLLAKLAGTSYCADAALAAATQKTGKQEQASPSCPASSKVGTVMVGAGAGPKPFYAPGTAYLAGPYKGAPLSLAVVTPAVAGPFDLGTVVVRNALYVDPTTAQVHAVSDPFPSILQGIPLDIRSVVLSLDKPEFTKNPTNCDPFSITGSALLVGGQSSPLSNHFQVAECGRLGFKPKLSLRLRGATKRTGNPGVSAVLTAPPGQANIAQTTVILPRSQFIDQSHVSNPCTRVQFNENACPAKSILGTATAWSPLLEQPLSGPVYFRSNGGERRLPDIVADLNGQIHVVLVGFIDSVKAGKEGSRVRTRFASVPDAPVSKFVLELKGGKRGLIENSKNLCKVTPVANVQMTAQNGKINDFEQKIETSCGSGKKKAKKHKRS